MNKLLIAMLHRAEVPFGKIPLAGEIEYRSWDSTAQELRDQYEAKWDAYLNGEIDLNGNCIEERIEQRRAIMRGHSPECNIVLDSENSIISTCTCR